jgi:hypothetical protein
MVAERALHEGVVFTLEGGPSTLPPGWKENDPAPEIRGSYRVRYHFTDRFRLPAILKYGIAKGDVALEPHGGFNSPCLTTDPDYQRQTWAMNPSLDRSFKGLVRLTVHIPRDDTALWHWPALCAVAEADPVWTTALATLAGQYADYSDAWWVYKGRVPPEWVVAVDFCRIEGAGMTYGCGKSGEVVG